MSDETTTSEQLAEIDGQAEPTPATEYTPPEGWRVVRFGDQLLPGDVWVNYDGTEQRSNILQWDASAVSGGRCIRRIEPQAESHTEQQIEELRSEVSYVQNLLGESRQRVTQLEELVGSLRTINRGCENAVRDAGKENFALKNQLEAVKAELAQVSKDRYALQIELDAAQQVPADSPELRQLRADLAEVTQDRDTYRHAHELLLNDANTAHERTKAMAVEAIAEWLEPIRLVDSAYLANATMQHLPQIMRTLTGLDSND